MPRLARPLGRHAFAVATTLALAGPTAAPAAEHTLMPTPQTVHIGHFLAILKPVLSVESGDIVTLESTASIVPSVVDAAGVVPPSAVPQYQRDIYGTVQDRGPGPHVLTGPIEVKGAMPGDVLEVRILDVQLALDWGYNRQRPYAGTLPDEFPALWNRIIPINRSAKTAEVAKGVVVPVDRPFFGIMGVAPPPAWGRISSVQPRAHGGNIDNRWLGAGTTIYLPVFVEGGLFTCGDGHAVQGDGEVTVNALETSLQGTFEFHVRPDLSFKYPRGETPTHYMTMGMDPDLDQCVVMALRDMIRLLGEKAGLSAEDAYTLCSLAADLHVTQTVNGNKGVHITIVKEVVDR